MASTTPLALLCLGEVPWDQSWKRNQSMVYHLGQLELIDRIIFVNLRDIWVRVEITSGSGSFWTRCAKLWASRAHAFDSQTHICNMFRFMPGKQLFPIGEQIEDSVMASRVNSLLGGREFILLNNHPFFFSDALLDQWMYEAALTVFDLSDDFVEFHEDEETRLDHEEYLRACCDASDVIFAVNEHVKGKYAAENPNAHVVLNSTNFQNFHRPKYEPIAYLEELKQSGRRMLGHTGVINRLRVDYSLLAELAEGRRDWDFVFVGSADASFHALVAAHPNVYLFDPVPYGALPDHIAYFDVTFIPFLVNEHTRGNDLLKFQDYMAMGKPIVTTDTGGARRHGDLLRIATGAEAFSAAVDAALDEDSEELMERRRESARSNSWERRAVDIEAILRQNLEAQAGGSSE
jgi:glycosyltransferase involved in cell wall biosynthesis